MGTSVLPHRYRINGVVSTDKTVMQNMETLASATQSWINYDVNDGKWAVVINTTGNSVAGFDDSNITSGITIQGTGLRELYNSVRVEFPHVDLRDEPDFVEITIPAEDRNANEPDNQLQMQFDVINDPVMAEMLGLVELKQSRVDRVITFTADRSYIGLKSGDLISVTNSMLGYTNKVFRIISISEVDDDDGNLQVEITGLEYDANVYSLDDLYRYERSDENGIVTIGSIGTPDAPLITAYTRNARPRVEIEATVPTGIVSGMEFWFSTDNANFSQVGTQYQVGGGNFDFGDTVTFDFDQVVTGNIYARVRAINSTTSSEFSNVGNLLNFVVTQATDAITENTDFIDSSTGNLLIANGLLALLGGLDGILSGNTQPGTAAGNIVNSMSNEGFVVLISTGTGNDPAIPPSSTGNVSSYVTMGNVDFTAPRTGPAKFDVLFDQNFSGAYGGRGVAFNEPEDIIRVRFVVYDITGGGNTVVGGEGSGGVGTIFWNDYAMGTVINLTANNTYRINFDAFNYCESTNNVSSADISYSWNVYTV